MAPTPSPSPLLQLLKLAQGVDGEEVGAGGVVGGREEKRKELTSSSSPFSGWDLKGTTQFSAALPANGSLL